jgi:uncharacterized protein
VTFEWDERKSRHNLRKHGVGFREAATVFDDSLSTTFPDEEHSAAERRFLTIGLSHWAAFSSWRTRKAAVQFESSARGA